MNLQQLLPVAGPEWGLDSPEAADLLHDLYLPARAEWLRLNFIASINGSVAGAEGTSQSLSNAADRRILGVIRRHADLVLVGAQSVRTEGYFLPKTAPLAILTGSGNLTGHRLPSDIEEGRVLVLCPPAAVDNVRASLGEVPATLIPLDADSASHHGSVSVAHAITVLRGRGFASIVCEGGPSLAAQLMDASLVDELCLSTSAQLLALSAPVLPGLTHPRTLHLEHLLRDDTSTLYARWAVEASAVEPA